MPTVLSAVGICAPPSLMDLTGRQRESGEEKKGQIEKDQQRLIKILAQWQFL